VKSNTVSGPDAHDVVDEVILFALRRIEEKLPYDPSLQVTVSVFLGEDWPYDFSVEVRIYSRVLDRERLAKVAEEVAEEAISLAEKKLREKGLKPLP